MKIRMVLSIIEIAMNVETLSMMCGAISILSVI